MNKLCSTFVALWNKTKSLSPLASLMLVSLFLALLLGSGNDVVGALSLFQSPLPSPSPTREEPTATPLPPTATPEPTATPVPTEAAEEPVPEPTEEPTVEPAEEPTEEPTVEPAEEPTEEPTVEPTEEPTPEPMMEEPEGEEEASSPEESSPLVFNWGMFLNTVIVTLSYAWICCGVCGLVGTPLAFILLYVGGKRRLIKRLEEGEETEQTPEADQIVG